MKVYKRAIAHLIPPQTHPFPTVSQSKFIVGRPTNEIGKLAVIIVLRTVLNFFLQQELQKAATRKRYLPK
ncbi:DUF1622 domain-containing protein [Fischerella sp.]|uniref:DUF1622 domain-containing protein n=1 Tax=Fischerella sp. TaxID=1191 RepID=UPI0025BAFBB8|nr:DUF1622 domain-containing protein [Fischerella sp.]